MMKTTSMLESKDKNELQNVEASDAKVRCGLTMLEVIFAMVVILIGLAGVGLLIPLAGRQAADSYQITQGLAAGENVFDLLHSNRIVSPTPDLPWCYIDDTNDLELEVRSLVELYDGLVLSTAGATSPNALFAAIRQNEAIGIGFCIDPLFWGAQQRSPNPFSAYPIILRSNFPFLLGITDPVTFGNLSAPVPRLRRISFRDVNTPQNVTAVRGTWLRQSAASRLAALYGGDVVQLAPAKNKASVPIRAMYPDAATGLLANSPSSSEAPTWLMTVTPADATPIIPTDLIKPDANNDYSNIPVFRPKLFDVAVVIFSKRNPTELSSTLPLGGYPIGERAMNVEQISPDALNSGTFDITLNANAAVESRIKQGDWLMMSRTSLRDLIPQTGRVQRQVHRWYRVLAVDRDGPFPIQAKVVGKPWDFSDGELEDLKNNGTSLPAILPPATTIHAVVLKDVVQVLERQIEID